MVETIDETLFSTTHGLNRGLWKISIKIVIVKYWNENSTSPLGDWGGLLLSNLFFYMILK